MFKLSRTLAIGVLGVHLVLPPVQASGGDECPGFSAAKPLGNVEASSLTEASGLVASRMNPGVLWTHNDSGNAPWLYALAENGSTRAIYAPTPISNIDWEDIALGPGPAPGQDSLYVGDIGDNKRRRKSITVYRIPEPRVISSGGINPSPLPGAVALRFEYPDGSHDAETLLVDPKSGDLYILTKNMKHGVSGLYRAAFPHNESEVSRLERVATIALPGGRSERSATGGDIAFGGEAVLVRSYTRGYFWTRPAGSTIASTLENPPCTVPIALEPQGESVAFSANGQNYFSLSESSRQPIYVYERVQPTGPMDPRPLSPDKTAPAKKVP